MLFADYNMPLHPPLNAPMWCLAVRQEGRLASLSADARLVIAPSIAQYLRQVVLCVDGRRRVAPHHMQVDGSISVALGDVPPSACRGTDCIELFWTWANASSPPNLAFRGVALSAPWVTLFGHCEKGAVTSRNLWLHDTKLPALGDVVDQAVLANLRCRTAASGRAAERLFASVPFLPALPPRNSMGWSSNARVSWVGHNTISSAMLQPHRARMGCMLDLPRQFDAIRCIRAHLHGRPQDVDFVRTHLRPSTCVLSAEPGGPLAKMVLDEDDEGGEGDVLRFVVSRFRDTDAIPLVLPEGRTFKLVLQWEFDLPVEPRQVAAHLPQGFMCSWSAACTVLTQISKMTMQSYILQWPPTADNASSLLLAENRIMVLASGTSQK